MPRGQLATGFGLNVTIVNTCARREILAMIVSGRILSNAGACTVLSVARTKRAATAIGLAIVTACATGKPAANEPGTPFRARNDSQVITRDAIAATQYVTAYEVIYALRNQWLKSKGQDDFTSPSAVQVYLGFQRLRGGAEELKDIRASTVESLRYYNPVEATGRFGGSHLSGAIVVTLAR